MTEIKSIRDPQKGMTGRIRKYIRSGLQVLFFFFLLLSAGCGLASAVHSSGEIGNSTGVSQVAGGGKVILNPIGNTTIQKVTGSGRTAPEKLPPAKSNEMDSSHVHQGLLAITSDYGHKRIWLKAIQFQEGDTVLNILQRNLDIETAYGGEFVNSIQGIRSGYSGNMGTAKVDWFFYINGVLMDRGVNDYEPEDGDIIWADYHHWGNNTFNPAMIGAFPEPFINGYDRSTTGVDLLVTAAQRPQGEKLADWLRTQGADGVRVDLFEVDRVFERTHPTIIVGTWSELQQFSSIQDLFSHPGKTGIFCRWNEGQLESLDSSGNPATEYGQGCGIAAATGTGMGDTCPLWIIIGTDSEGTKGVISWLISSGDAWGWGVVVSPRGATKLPAEI